MLMQTVKETILIGDIHGQGATLAALLDGLGWRRRGGRLRGPGGIDLVFVGDLIDRGPENRRTVELVYGLVELGDAVCLLGNHEYNAIQFHTPDPGHPGKHLREQSEKHIRQHEAVLEEFKNDNAGLNDMLAWFRTLPVAVEGENWRCIHACWHQDMLARLKSRNGAWYLPEKRWTAAARPDEPEYDAIDILTKGIEFVLPDNATFIDKDGHRRREARLKWWESNPRTLGEALLFQSIPEGLDLNAPFPPEKAHGYPADAPPVFFGHYWNSGPIRPERPNAACLDYSAGTGDRLVAYRRANEATLQIDQFVAQKVI